VGGGVCSNRGAAATAKGAYRWAQQLSALSSARRISLRRVSRHATPSEARNADGKNPAVFGEGRRLALRLLFREGGEGIKNGLRNRKSPGRARYSRRYSGGLAWAGRRTSSSGSALTGARARTLLDEAGKPAVSEHRQVGPDAREPPCAIVHRPTRLLRKSPRKILPGGGTADPIHGNLGGRTGPHPAYDFLNSLQRQSSIGRGEGTAEEACRKDLRRASSTRLPPQVRAPETHRLLLLGGGGTAGGLVYKPPTLSINP